MDKITALWQARATKHDSYFFSWTTNFVQNMIDVGEEQVQLREGILSIADGLTVHLKQVHVSNWWSRCTIPSLMRGTPDETPETIPQQLVVNFNNGNTGMGVEDPLALRQGSVTVSVNTETPRFAKVADIHPVEYFEEWLGVRLGKEVLPSNQTVVFCAILRAAHTRGFRFDNVTGDETDVLEITMITREEVLVMKFDFDHLRLTNNEFQKQKKAYEEYVQSNPPTGG